MAVLLGRSASRRSIHDLEGIVLIESRDRVARVLVVDDEDLNVTLLSRILDRAGVGTIEGITASHLVMDRIASFDPDVVLLDLHMPHPDGFALLQQIGNLDKGTAFLPVIVLTADATDDAKTRALALGATDFLTKPFAANETVLRVNNHIRTRMLHETVRRQAAALGAQLEEIAAIDQETKDRIRRVTQVVDDADNALTMVFQPIVDLDRGRSIGAEALARFGVVPLRPPNEWFADAAEAGIALHLELAAVRRALSQADQLPDDTFLSVNVSPPTFRSPAFAELVSAGTTRPLVVELTEHEQIADYVPINDAMKTLRHMGLRLAVDDAGSGFASLHHILNLQPDFIKLDLALVTGIDSDPARRSLASALVRFSTETGAALIAEGIETQDELDTLRELGVTLGQGYHIARPSHLPLPEITAIDSPATTERP